MHSFFVDLNHLDLLSVSGPDSAKLLQGQITCDIEEITDDYGGLGAACDNKGRVLTNFRLIKSLDAFYLEMQPGMAAIFKPVLEKYAVFYQCDIINAGGNYFRYGLVGYESLQILSQFLPSVPNSLNQCTTTKELILVKTDEVNDRFELWIKPEFHQDITTQLKQALVQAPASKWVEFDIGAGIFQIEKNDSGLYTPQQLNLDLAHYISFTKGCYTGQEIVARMHYRGKAKNRLFSLEIESQEKPELGNALIYNGKEVGKILKIAEIRDLCYKTLIILQSALENVDASDSITIKGQPSARTTLIPLQYQD